MNLHTARIIVGLFVTHNRKGINSIAKYMGKKPSEILQRAYIKMGNHKPITAYKASDGTVMPIGVTKPPKPKYGIGYDGKKSSDPQTGAFDNYNDYMQELRAPLANVEVVID